MYGEHATGIASNGMGPAQVTWESLAAWCRLTGERLAGWEAKAIVRLGHARAVIESEKLIAKARTDGAQHQNRSR